MLKNRLKLIFKILERKDKKKFFVAIFLLINKSILEILSISLIIPILNFLVNDNYKSQVYLYLGFLKKYNEKELIVLFIIFFLIIYFVKTLFILFYNKWNSKFINYLNINNIQRLLEKYLEKNYAFFLNTNSASLIRNLTSETSIFASGIVGHFILAITHLVFILSVCAFLIFYNFYSFYVILILLLLSFLIIKISNKKFQKWGDIRQRENAAFLKRLNEVFGSIKEIILYRKKNFFLSEVYKHNKKFGDANIYRDISLAIISPIIEFLGIFVFFNFLIFLILFSSIDIAQLMVLFGVLAFSAIKLLPAVIGFVRSVQSIRFNLPAIKILEELIEKKSSEYKANPIEKKEINIEKLKLSDVSFYYSSQNKNLLSKINLEIKSGDKIGIIGETGSGKTTLLNLISGLIQPKSGVIEINNLNYKNMEKSINFSVGYVSQAVYLADESVFYNVSLANNLKDLDKSKILEILEKLNLKYLNDIPIETIESIGEKGSRLSGGQVQRIGIARALFRNPSMLILDEATNALDKNTEDQVLNCIFKEFTDKIVIICTHKKELLKYCNKIIEVRENSVNIKII